MYQVRAADARGMTRLAWLDSRHSFSFGDYYDPRFDGVSALRVINDDEVIPGAGFGPHGHRDMEILTYVTEGVIAHEDSTGKREQVPAGEFQLMHAGKGIYHSEFNASPSARLRFLQIWILPNEIGGTPGYEQKLFARADGLQLVASPGGVDGSLSVRQDARVWRATLGASATLGLPLAASRVGYVHVVHGALAVAGNVLAKADGIAITDEANPLVVASAAAEFLFFDLPPVVARS